MAIIDLGELEKPIVIIEELINDCNEIEKDLIIQELAKRRQQAKARQRVNDTIQGISVKDLFTKITKERDKE